MAGVGAGLRVGDRQADLAHPGRGEAHEGGDFARELDGQGLVGRQLAQQAIAGPVEAYLQVGRGAHDSPPKISTSRKAHTGLAWPTVMT